MGGFVIKSKCHLLHPSHLACHTNFFNLTHDYLYLIYTHMSHYEHFENQIENHDNFLKHKSYN
jgi:hypothetical protein